MVAAYLTPSLLTYDARRRRLSCDNNSAAAAAAVSHFPRRSRRCVVSLESAGVGAAPDASAVSGEDGESTVPSDKEASDTDGGRADSIARGDNQRTRICVKDYVVHAEFGIGRFLGTSQENDVKCAAVQFSDGLVHVPLQSARRLLSFYRSASSDPPPALSRREHTAAWERAVAKARKSAKTLALNLVQLYSSRNKQKRAPCAPDGDRFTQFENAWEYRPTTDQLMCFEDVRRDMCDSNAPMDRLVCGDVGFGKTEVALRAALRAVCNGRQVIVLAPTTLLASQHHTYFCGRMADFGVSVGLHTRFVSDADKRRLAEGARSGEVNVIIGTHGLLEPDAEVANLGLVVIDEEQRFGVYHKEKFKSLRKGVDVLTLSATPIPRTLYMGMSGIRDMSLMRSPPPSRKAIETLIVAGESDQVGEAIRAELARKGQVFYVTPRVKDLPLVRTRVEAAAPNARLIVAHSRVKDLDVLMYQFARGEADVLLSTTIIESGIDIPSVNTLVVHRADMFGLAQLYQLRGRVGRSEMQAKALLTYESETKLSATAMQRVFAMEEYNALGSSFNLATRDLEIRGAGSLYGAQQSGLHDGGVGLDLYMGFLRESVDQWKLVKRYTYAKNPQIELSKRTPRIPALYIPNNALREKISTAVSESKTLFKVDELRKRVERTFGDLPPAADTFFTMQELVLVCRELGIEQVQNVDGVSINLSTRMPQACWQKIILDATNSESEVCSREEAEAITKFLVQRCRFVDAKVVLLRGLGGRPPSAQLRQLVKIFRPLADAAAASRREADVASTS